MIVKSVVLCEQCRPEAGNKWIIIGAAGGDIVVQSFPATLQVSIYFELEQLPAGHNSIEIELHASDQNIQINASVAVEEACQLVVLPTPQLNLTVDKPGEIYAAISRDGGASQEVLRRKIILGA